MKISSWNEWSKLKEIVVGTANNANWPRHDPIFRAEKDTTLWKETPLPAGPVPQWIIDETNEDLENLCNLLRQADVVVHRPTDIDFVAIDGMYNYCPRDRLLIAGDVIVDTAMKYPCRDIEIEALTHVTEGNSMLTMPRKSNLILDAANICRLDDTLLYLESSSGNKAAAEWLSVQLPNWKVEMCNFYAGAHIDSTITALREGLVVLNASRVNPENCPKVFDKWDKIYIDEVVPQSFYQYPYAGKWIALNMLSIDPQTVVVDKKQPKLIKKLEQHNFTVVPCELRHSRKLGGGFHCVTLDTWRQDS